MLQQPTVLAATLNWNERARTERCLNSLLALDYPALETVVVDNNSRDGSYEALREKYPQVTFIRHRENFGYGEGVNGQIRRAIETGAGYLLSVHNDTVVEAQALAALVRTAEQNPKVGLVFPKVLSFDGKPVEKESSSVFLVRMDAVKKAGYLNPRYFFYADDKEWFLRLGRAGYTKRYVPEALGRHEGAATIGKNSRAFHYYKTRNWFYFQKVLLPAWLFLFFAAAQAAGLVFCGLPCAWLKGQGEALKGKAEGLLDFLRAKRGPKDFQCARPSFGQRLAGALAAKEKKPLSAVRLEALSKERPLRIQVNLDWNMGDEIMASPVLERLKAKYPGAQIDLLSRHPALFENHAFVDSVNAGAAFGPDLFLDLHKEVRHRKRSDYLTEMAGVSGWAESKIYLRSEEILAAQKRWNLEGKELRIALCPEVWWLARRWPRERWIQLAERLEKEKKARLFILGSEEPLFPVGTNLVGKTDVRESCAVMSRCHLFIGHDSGPLYMALAVHAPSVGLFGPLDPGLLYPEVPYFKPVWTDLDCRGCWPQSRMIYRDHCPKIVPDCMTSIALERVWNATEEMLLKFGP